MKDEQEYECGYLYVLAVSGIARVKVGYTNTTPQARLAQLNAPNGGAGSHRLEYIASWLCREPLQAESMAHARLSSFRATDSIGTEFFNLDPVAATAICNYCVLAHDATAKPFGLARLEIRALINGERSVKSIPQPERAIVEIWLNAFRSRRAEAWSRACAIVDAAIPLERRPGAVETTAMAQPIFRDLFPELRMIEELEKESPVKPGSGLARVYELFMSEDAQGRGTGNPMGYAEAFCRAIGEKQAVNLDDERLTALVHRFIELKRGASAGS